MYRSDTTLLDRPPPMQLRKSRFDASREGRAVRIVDAARSGRKRRCK